MPPQPIVAPSSRHACHATPCPCPLTLELPHARLLRVLVPDACQLARQVVRQQLAQRGVACARQPQAQVTTSSRQGTTQRERHDGRVAVVMAGAAGAGRVCWLLLLPAPPRPSPSPSPSPPCAPKTRHQARWHWPHTHTPTRTHAHHPLAHTRTSSHTPARGGGTPTHARTVDLRGAACKLGRGRLRGQLDEGRGVHGARRSAVAVVVGPGIVQVQVCKAGRGRGGRQGGREGKKRKGWSMNGVRGCCWRVRACVCEVGRRGGPQGSGARLVEVAHGQAGRPHVACGRR